MAHTRFTLRKAFIRGHSDADAIAMTLGIALVLILWNVL